MFLLISGRHPDGLQHGVSIQISINFSLQCRRFWWFSSFECSATRPAKIRRHCRLYKFGEKASPHILQKKKKRKKKKKNCCDLNLGIVTFFLSSDSGPHLLNSFDFYFEWRDTEKQQLLKYLTSSYTVSKICSVAK